MPRFIARGITVECDCGFNHMLRTHGKKKGQWKCGLCGAVLEWQWKGKVTVLAPPTKVIQQEVKQSTLGFNL